MIGRSSLSAGRGMFIAGYLDFKHRLVNQAHYALAPNVIRINGLCRKDVAPLIGMTWVLPAFHVYQYLPLRACTLAAFSRIMRIVFGRVSLPVCDDADR